MARRSTSVAARALRLTQTYRSRSVAVSATFDTKPASKAILGMDRPTRGRINERLEELAADPFDPRIGKSLVNMHPMRSSRVGGWRILYAVNTNDRIVRVYGVKPRGEAHR